MVQGQWASSFIIDNRPGAGGNIAGLADPKVKAQLAHTGAVPFVASPMDFGKFIADETQKWGKVIRAAHIKPQ